MTTNISSVFPEIERVFRDALNTNICDERKNQLQALIDYIKDKIGRQEQVRLNFICTHNSRRSHLAQVWAQSAALHFGVTHVQCYSGGTEATALFPMVAETLKKSGFMVMAISEGVNPIYAIKFSINEQPVVGFSKTYDHEYNPKSEFAAVMTCAQADADCPFVGGAEARISLPYDDPKAFDDTPQKAAKYRERSLQIAAEMAYVFSKIK